MVAHILVVAPIPAVVQQSWVVVDLCHGTFHIFELLTIRAVRYERREAWTNTEHSIEIKICITKNLYFISRRKAMVEAKP